MKISLLLWFWCLSSSVNIFISRTTGPILANLVCSICRVRRQAIVNFMTPTPRGGNFGGKKCKIDVFLKNLHLYSQAQMRQTKYVVMMAKEGSTKIVTFMTPEAGVLVLGCGHISHRVKMHYSYKNHLLYSQA